MPKRAEDFMALLNPTEQILVNWFRTPKKHGGAGAEQQPDQSWVCGQWSYGRIARSTLMHWTTVRRAVLGLRAKCSLDVRAVWYRNREGGRRRGTLYSLKSYNAALEERRKIDGAAVTPDGHLLYIGRRRRVMTLKEAAEWAIDLARVPAARAKAAFFNPTRATTREEAPAAPPPADAQAVLQAMLAACPANLDDARRVLDVARAAVPAVPVDEVCAFVRQIAAKKAATDAKLNRPFNIAPGWFIDRAPSYADHWKVKEAERAAEHKRVARIERDARLNRYADYIGRLEALKGDGERDPMPDFASEREFLEFALAEADPDELAEARARQA